MAVPGNSAAEAVVGSIGAAGKRTRAADCPEARARLGKHKMAQLDRAAESPVAVPGNSAAVVGSFGAAGKRTRSEG